MATNESVAAKPVAPKNTITIDGVEYKLADLSAEAKTQIRNVRTVEQQIRRLQLEISIAQTARAAYAGMLKAKLTSKA